MRLLCLAVVLSMACSVTAEHADPQRDTALGFETLDGRMPVTQDGVSNLLRLSGGNVGGFPLKVGSSPPTPFLHTILFEDRVSLLVTSSPHVLAVHYNGENIKFEQVTVRSKPEQDGTATTCRVWFGEAKDLQKIVEPPAGETPTTMWTGYEDLTSDAYITITARTQISGHLPPGNDNHYLLVGGKGNLLIDYVNVMRGPASPSP